MGHSSAEAGLLLQKAPEAPDLCLLGHLLDVLLLPTCTLACDLLLSFSLFDT